MAVKDMKRCVGAVLIGCARAELGEELRAVRSLWGAAIWQAVNDALANPDAGKSDQRVVVQQARSWWLSDAGDDVQGSLEWICSQIELNAGALRRRVVDMWTTADRERAEQTQVAMHGGRGGAIACTRLHGHEARARVYPQRKAVGA